MLARMLGKKNVSRFLHFLLIMFLPLSRNAKNSDCLLLSCMFSSSVPTGIRMSADVKPQAVKFTKHTALKKSPSKDLLLNFCKSSLSCCFTLMYAAHVFLQTSVVQCLSTHSFQEPPN